MTSSPAAWDAELLGIALSHLVTRLLLPEGTPLVAAVDDTLFKRSGKKVLGALWQHDGAARGRARSATAPASSPWACWSASH